MKVQRIDHIVMTVHNIDAACDFYSRVLGMEIITFRGNRKALQFGSQKINLHEYGKEFEPKALSPAPGALDLCFITDMLLEQVLQHMQSHGIEIIEGPVQRTGVAGAILPVYVRDIDGNLIEISNYI
jgi:catechol 2,3-dioxygenase-like lactoylglutathione lyase family enzyme